MSINNFNYNYYSSRLNNSSQNTPSFKGAINDEELKKRFETIINSRSDLQATKAELEKIVTPENIPVLESLAVQKEENGYPRFTETNIKITMQNANEGNSKTLLSVINERADNKYKYDPYDIRIMSEFLNEKNCGLFEKINSKRNDFDVFTLKEILTYSSIIDEEIFFKILEEKNKKGYAFDSTSIYGIAPYCTEKNKALLNCFLANAKNRNGEIEDIIGLDQICSSCNPLQKDFAMELMKKKNSSRNPLYNIFSISNIVKHITPENLEMTRKLVNYKNEDEKEILSSYEIEEFLKSGNIDKYGDIITNLIERNKTKSFAPYMNLYLSDVFSHKDTRIDRVIDNLGEEDFYKFHLKDLKYLTNPRGLSEEKFNLAIENFKIIKENTPKEIWDSIESISTIHLEKPLKPSEVSQRIKFLEQFPENIRKRMDGDIIESILSEDFTENDYHVSQEAIKYFEGVNPQILNKISPATIISLILVPEEAHSIKEGLDLLCSLKPETYENCKSMTTSILYLPASLIDEGYKVDNNVANEFLDILASNLEENIISNLKDSDLKNALISYSSTRDKETLLRNIEYLNELSTKKELGYYFPYGKFLKATKDTDFKQNQLLLDKMLSYENLEKLIKKYKGSEVEKILKEMFSIDPNDKHHFVFNYRKENSDLSSLLTKDGLEEKALNSAFESFVKTVKMANRELVKKDAKTGEITFNFLNGQTERTEKSAREELNDKFRDSFADIMKAIMLTDNGTINNLLNRRFNQFIEQIKTINSLNPEDSKILSTLIKDCGILNANGKVVTVPDRDKIDFVTLIRSNRRLIASGNEGINFNDYLKDTTGFAVENKNIKKIIDVKALKKDILKKALINSGISEQELSQVSLDALNWDGDYTHLLFAKPPKDKGELATVIKESTLGNFQNFITDETNEYGIANTNTENAFYEAGINFEVWDKQEAKDLKVTSKIGGENINIELWNRNPQESLFDGSYTTCCTALDAGNGGSMARYLLNKSFNVVELKNDKGKTFAMSRIYMANVEEKPSLIMENIEINNNWLDTLSDEDKKQLKDSIVDYMKQFAGALSDKDVPIYFSTSYNKLENLWKEENNTVEKEIEFIGDISPKDIYMNTFKGYTRPVGQKTKAQFYEIK